MRKSTEPQYICCVNVFECPNQGLSWKCSTVFLKEILMITDLSVLLRVVRNSGSCCPFWVVWKLEIHTYLFMFSFETVRDLLLFWMTNTLKKRGEFRGKKGLIWHQIFKMTVQNWNNYGNPLCAIDSWTRKFQSDDFCSSIFALCPYVHCLE